MTNYCLVCQKHRESLISLNAAEKISPEDQKTVADHYKNTKYIFEQAKIAFVKERNAMVENVSDIFSRALWKTLRSNLEDSIRLYLHQYSQSDLDLAKKIISFLNSNKNQPLVMVCLRKF